MRPPISPLLISAIIMLMASITYAESRYTLTQGVDSNKEIHWVFGRGTESGDPDPWRSCREAAKHAGKHLLRVLERELPGFTPPRTLEFPIQSVSFSARNLACTVVVGMSVSGGVEHKSPPKRDLVKKLLHLR